MGLFAGGRGGGGGGGGGGNCEWPACLPVSRGGGDRGRFARRGWWWVVVVGGGVELRRAFGSGSPVRACARCVWGRSFATPRL